MQRYIYTRTHTRTHARTRTHIHTHCVYGTQDQVRELLFKVIAEIIDCTVPDLVCLFFNPNP